VPLRGLGVSGPALFRREGGARSLFVRLGEVDRRSDLVGSRPVLFDTHMAAGVGRDGDRAVPKTITDHPGRRQRA
jgi:hypothetical protein